MGAKPYGAGKTAVMIGAGNVGRGFVGPAFAASGYETVFIDIDEALVKEINKRGEYPLRVFSPDGEVTETVVRGVRAVEAKDMSVASAEIARAEICATAVGVRAMPDIARLLAMGLAVRARTEGAGPLDTIVCENTLDAGAKLKEHVMDVLPSDFERAVEIMSGYPEAVIGRMVPVQTDEMKDGDPLRVCAEKYAFLPVDKAAFKGDIPQIEGMVPLDRFKYYVKRKLFVHNLGHAAIAYLGLLKGYEMVSDAAADPEIMFLASGAMRESAAALACENSGDASNLSRHVDNLLYRVSNRALKDTCLRVAADPVRKLGKQDRLIGAIENCADYGLPHVYIAAAAAAAALVLEKTWEGEGEIPSLSAVTGLEEDSGPYKLIMALGTAYSAATAKNGNAAAKNGDAVANNGDAAAKNGSTAISALCSRAVRLAGDITIL
ncbi:MAG: mannitol dehydrogenase [Clostridiales bacterium]|nr:mannitol dehydrogenase [Clostridiales bacterium]